MDFSMIDLVPAMAEIFLLSAVCIILIADLFISDEHRYLTYGATQLSLVMTALICLAGIDAEPVHAFSGLFVADAFSSVLKIGVCLSVAAGLVYSRAYLGPRGMYLGEYFVLAMFATLGMLGIGLTILVILGRAAA